MSVAVPDAETVLGEPSPIAGSATEAFALARSLTSLAEDATDSRTQLTLASAELLNLQGDGVVELMSTLDSHLRPAVAQVIDEAEDAATACTRFGRVIEELHERARTIIRSCENSLQALTECVSDLARAAHTLGIAEQVPHRWDTPPALTPPEPLGICLAPQMSTAPERQVATHEWITQATLWHEQLHTITRHRQDWMECVRERTRAEEELRDMLTGMPLVTAFTRSRTGRPNTARLASALTGLPYTTQPKPSQRSVDPALEWILSDLRTPHEVAEAWSTHPLRDTWRRDMKELPPWVWFRLADTPGLPTVVQDRAARLALSYARRSPEEAYRLMGFAGSTLGITRFEQHLDEIDAAIGDAEQLVSDMKSSGRVYLLAFGNHDDRLTTAISIGNPDTASHVGVNVSGMFSTVGNMRDTLPGVASLAAEAQRLSPREPAALVHWIGYRSPGLIPGSHHVLGMGDAHAGGARLAHFLDGIVESRHAEGQQPTTVRTALGHSYGSTTGAEALKLITHPIDTYSTYGSAGVRVSDVSQLAVNTIYSTSARGDQIAGLGIIGSGRSDPRAFEEVIEFSAEQRDGYQRVTAHTMYAADEASTVLNPALRGYLSTGTQSLHYMAGLVVGVAESGEVKR